MTINELIELYKKLQLTAVAKQVDEACQQALRQQLPYSDFLS
jgi:hypothetical protein